MLGRNWRLAGALSTLAVLLLVVSGSAFGAITAVTDSRVQGFFSTSNNGFNISDPVGLATGVAAAPPNGSDGIAGVPAPPAGGAAVAGANGVNWVPFTFPNPRFYSGNDNAFNVAGQRTSTGTAIVGGFNIPTSNSITSTFVLVPQNSFLLQELGAPGVAYTQLNFSIDYAVNAGGLLGGNHVAAYNVFGNVQGGGFAEFGAQYNFWDVTGAPVALGQINLNFLQNGNGAFNQNLVDNQFINGIVGAGTLRITGNIYWHADPAEITIIGGVPEPGSAILAGLGLSAVGILAVRKRRQKAVA